MKTKSKLLVQTLFVDPLLNHPFLFCLYLFALLSDISDIFGQIFG